MSDRVGRAVSARERGPVGYPYPGGETRSEGDTGGFSGCLGNVPLPAPRAPCPECYIITPAYYYTVPYRIESWLHFRADLDTVKIARAKEKPAGLVRASGEG